MSGPLDRDGLAEALARLQRAAGPAGPGTGPQAEAALPDLLEQCRAGLARAADSGLRLRALHHFACSGGAMVAECLADMPNTVVLGEIDPLSRLGLDARRAAFTPSDFLVGLLDTPRGIPDEVVQAAFRAGIATLGGELSARGQSLVLCDHAHSQFCTDGTDPETRPTLREMLAKAAGVLSVVTVRHPRDAFMALRRNGWVTFSPDTIEEYCRRHLLFLDRHAGLSIFRYEDILADPGGAMQQICDLLDLRFSPDFEVGRDLFAAAGTEREAGAPAEPVPDALARDMAESPGYAEMCDRLGYAR